MRERRETSSEVARMRDGIAGDSTEEGVKQPGLYTRYRRQTKNQMKAAGFTRGRGERTAKNARGTKKAGKL